MVVPAKKELLKFGAVKTKLRYDPPITNIVNGKNQVDFSNQEVEEFYMYDPNVGSSQNATYRVSDVNNVKIAKDAIVYVTTGLVDRNKQTVLSFLHKAMYFYLNPVK